MQLHVIRWITLLRRCFGTVDEHYHLYRTIAKYHLAAIFKGLFVCHTKLSSRKNLKLTGDLKEGQDVNYWLRK